MTYPNPISSPYVLFKVMKQPKTLKEIKAERRAIIENAWFNQEISDDQLEAEYKALGIVNKCNKLPQQYYNLLLYKYQALVKS